MIDVLLHILAWTVTFLLTVGFVIFLFKAFQSLWKCSEDMFKD